MATTTKPLVLAAAKTAAVAAENPLHFLGLILQPDERCQRHVISFLSRWLVSLFCPPGRQPARSPSRELRTALLVLLAASFRCACEVLRMPAQSRPTALSFPFLPRPLSRDEHPENTRGAPGSAATSADRALTAPQLFCKKTIKKRSTLERRGESKADLGEIKGVAGGNIGDRGASCKSKRQLQRQNVSKKAVRSRKETSKTDDGGASSEDGENETKQVEAAKGHNGRRRYRCSPHGRLHTDKAERVAPGVNQLTAGRRAANGRRRIPHLTPWLR